MCHPARFVAWLLLQLSALTMISTAPASAAEGERLNIVFIFTDDHAYQALSAYGHGINQTPNLDRLAHEGMLFRNCFVTNSICGPARAVIQSGKYSHLNGFHRNGDRFDGSQQTFPKLLQAAGYQTAIIGKWHLESEPQGFNHWMVLPGQGLYYNPPMLAAGGTVKHSGYTTDLIGDMAVEWLKSGRDQSKPFMLMCQHKAPHREWEPGPHQMGMYKDAKFPEPDTLFDDYETRGTAAHTQDMTIAETMNDKDLKLDGGPKNLTPEQQAVWDAHYQPANEAFRKLNPQGDELVRWKYQRYMQDYLACVAGVDANVGKLLDYLDESGLAKNTVVLYASDQGFYLGEHGWFDKRWIYEESLRTPFLVRWPGVTKPGSENRDFVSNLDFAETFLDIAGVSVPDDMQGRSLKPILSGQTPADWRKSHYYHYYEFPGPHSVQRHYGVRTESYTLANFYRLGEWELYDLEKDPKQLNNVYADPAYAETVSELKAELTRLRELYQVPEDTLPDQPMRKRPLGAAKAKQAS